MVRVREYVASVATGRLWRTAALTAAGAIGAVSHAEAALYYWFDSDPGFSQPGPPVAQRRQQARRRQAKKVEASLQQAAKPQGPLIIAISIQNQRLKIYDAAGFFAETPISSGMAGHPTPMGVFSVIQKQKLHHSNIYSGAPMPYMQRITWSGIAIHAGVLPGHPASHGCIRMPMAFAVKMWGWTRMGARVVVTPGEMTPASFSHPLLVAQKVVPQPMAAEEPNPDALPAAKSDKNAALTNKPAFAEASLELRPSVGHDDGVKPVMAEPSASMPLREQTHTADASTTLPARNTSATMTDATSSGAPSPKTEPATAKSGEAASSDDTPVEAKSSEAVTSETKPAETDASATEAVKTEEHPDKAKVEAKSDDVKTQVSKLD